LRKKDLPEDCYHFAEEHEHVVLLAELVILFGVFRKKGNSTKLRNYSWKRNKDKKYISGENTKDFFLFKFKCKLVRELLRVILVCFYLLDRGQKPTKMTLRSSLTSLDLNLIKKNLLYFRQKYIFFVLTEILKRGFASLAIYIKIQINH